MPRSSSWHIVTFFKVYCTCVYSYKYDHIWGQKREYNLKAKNLYTNCRNYFLASLFYSPVFLYDNRNFYYHAGIQSISSRNVTVRYFLPKEHSQWLASQLAECVPIYLLSIWHLSPVGKLILWCHLKLCQSRYSQTNRLISSHNISLE